MVENVMGGHDKNATNLEIINGKLPPENTWKLYPWEEDFNEKEKTKFVEVANKVINIAKQHGYSSFVLSLRPEYESSAKNMSIEKFRKEQSADFNNTGFSVDFVLPTALMQKKSDLKADKAIPRIFVNYSTMMNGNERYGSGIIQHEWGHNYFLNIFAGTKLSQIHDLAYLNPVRILADNSKSSKDLCFNPKDALSYKSLNDTERSNTAIEIVSKSQTLIDLLDKFSTKKEMDAFLDLYEKSYINPTEKLVKIVIPEAKKLGDELSIAKAFETETKLKKAFVNFKISTEDEAKIIKTLDLDDHFDYNSLLPNYVPELPKISDIQKHKIEESSLRLVDLLIKSASIKVTELLSFKSVFDKSEEIFCDRFAMKHLFKSTPDPKENLKLAENFLEWFKGNSISSIEELSSLPISGGKFDDTVENHWKSLIKSNYPDDQFRYQSLKCYFLELKSEALGVKNSFVEVTENRKLKQMIDGRNIEI